MRLYTRQTIAEFPWPDTPDGDYAARYFLSLVERGPLPFIANAYNTDVLIAAVGQAVLPLTVSDSHPDSTYTVSPFNHYVSYGAYEEAERLGTAVGAVIRLLAKPLAVYLRRHRLDRVVFVNNWLLSTNLYPRLDEAEITALAVELPRLFRDRAIVFRSVEDHRNPRLLAVLKGLGYRLVMSRQVWFQEPSSSMRTLQFKKDMRHYRRTRYEMVRGSQIGLTEASRLRELYDRLYLDKYSRFNPQFTEEFIRLALERDTLELVAFRLDGRIDAVLGYFVRNGALTAPLFGYDTSLPQSTALYRLLSVQLILEAERLGVEVHASAGVGGFKKLRGGRSAVEYNAVYDAHLAPGRRRAWTVLKALGDAAVPLFRRYGW
jgi:hypothetical protein